MIRDIYEVRATDDFKLICEMENGEVYEYDMSFVHNQSGEVIDPLKDIDFFKKVWIEYGALEWPSGYGIHGDTVARDGVLLKQAA